MDYKTFLNELEIIRKDFSSFTDEAIQKNVLKADEIVKDYLIEIEKGNNSLKSYKAKIIRNELEHHQNDLLVNDIEETVKVKTQDLLMQYFENYFDRYQNSKYSQTKEKDLKALLNNNKKEKQETTVRRTTVDKDLQNKFKEYEELATLKEQEYNGKISEIKSKLTSNLLKIRDKTERENLEDLRKLLDCDDKNEIKEIKNRIKAARENGLTEEYNLKVQTYRSLEFEEKEYFKNKSNVYSDYKKYELDKKKKLASLDSRLTDLLIQSEEIEKKYDLEQLVLNRQKQYESEKIFFNLLEEHNKYISTDFDTYENEDKLFIFNIVILNLYHILINLEKNNCYDELIIIIYNNITYVKQVREKITNYLITSEEKHRLHEKELKDIFRSKEGITEVFLENVTTSLSRFYTNLNNQIEIIYLCYFRMFMASINAIVSLHDNIMSEKEAISLIPRNYIVMYTKYSYYDLTEFGYMYKYKSEIEYDKKIISYREYLIIINSELRELKEKLKDNYEKDIQLLERCLLKNKKCHAKLAKNNNNFTERKISKLSLEESKLDEKKIKLVTNSKKGLKKSTKNNISSAKKLLVLYKKQLN